MKFLAVFLSSIFLSFSAFSALNITSYNIRMFDSKKNPTNKTELAKILKQTRFDFLTVQEIVNGTSFRAFIKKNFPGYKVVLTKCGGAGRQKIGFVYNPLKIKKIRTYEDKRISDPGVVVGEFGCGTLRPALVGMFQEIKRRKKFVAIGVHLKAGGSESSYEKRANQYKILERMIGELKRADHDHVIVLGDFNTTGYNDHDIDYDRFNDMLQGSRTKTVSERLDCTSYWSGENRDDKYEESSILDHVLHTSRFLSYRKISVKIASHCAKVRCDLTPSKSELGLHYEEVSDHCPVNVSFK